MFLFTIILSFDPFSILLCNVFSFKRNGSMVYGLESSRVLGPLGSCVLNGPASSRVLGSLGSSRVLSPCFPVCRMKFGQLINVWWDIFSFKSNAENEAGTLVSYLFLFFKKALYEVKAKDLHLSFNIFW